MIYLSVCRERKEQDWNEKKNKTINSGYVLFFPYLFLFARFCALKMYAFITRELKAVAFCKAQ